VDEQMKILEDFATDVGPVSSDLIREDQYETWQAEHPDRAVIEAQRFVLVMHQRLPDAE
jgi:hypothetical protein